MSSESVVELSSVTKTFPSHRRSALALHTVPTKYSLAPDSVVALDDVSLDLFRGEILGIIGRNGAGKSTLLRLVAEIYAPTMGSIEVSGRAAAIVDLGSAFHPDLTVKENLPVSLRLMGHDHAADQALSARILDFAGIADRADQPVKHLSTGMTARLGFSIAIHAPSDVLLVDEVLSVGDTEFQQRCVERVRARALGGTAVMFVSHSLELVGQLCTRVAWLDQGRLVDAGSPQEVIARYTQLAPPPMPVERQPAARIVSLELPTQTIVGGSELPIRCVVDVADGSHPLMIRSEITVPSQPGGINADRLPGGSLGTPGRWDLSARVGPISTTGGKLEFSVSLLGGESDPSELIDRQSATFEVDGEDFGVVRLAMHATWSVSASGPKVTSDLRPDPPSKHELLWGADVHKTYRRSRRLHGRHNAVLALGGVDLAVLEGSSVGLVGSNGAGKSTLLRALTNVTDPTAGDVGGSGRTVALLELGVGFHQDLTGEENLSFTWRLHGGDSSKWPQALVAIEEFAAIGASLDVPTKHYSTGMSARLAIALAMELQPDVLVVDEALSVGDQQFREKVRGRLAEMVGEGMALVFASHDHHLLQSVCKHAIRLEEGRIADFGASAEVLMRGAGFGWSGAAIVGDDSIRVSDLTASPRPLVWNEPFQVNFNIEVSKINPHARVEVSIRDPLGDEDHSRVRPADEILMATLCRQRLPLIDGLLDSIGRKRVTGIIEAVPIMNTHDLVVSIVDEIEGHTLSEKWCTLYFGAVGPSNAGVAVDWIATRRPHVADR